MRGPSPRVRGSRPRDAAGTTTGRSIPACAGKPRDYSWSRPNRRVHPRVCGEALSAGVSITHSGGPSPRVRGSQARSGRRARGEGSIPACAGKPTAIRTSTRSSGVHPRVCGEAAHRMPTPLASRGPSPRVRGSHPAERRDDRATGSIPACAGKPSVASKSVPRPRVHPRVCGEAASISSATFPGWGPSPRVRGSRPAIRPAPWSPGSIPACAGKPLPHVHAQLQVQVHPRVCGEAAWSPCARGSGSGPSPRVRGSQSPRRSMSRGRGSIPACAGKPTTTKSTSGNERVHPRVCGEAKAPQSVVPGKTGPSPRVRGSLVATLPAFALLGSIPACAGKPVAIRRRYG